MTTLIVGLHVFVCLFLIIVILLQAGRGQGLSWGVFGGTPQSILGTKTTSFFARVTAVCAILFLITCIALNIIETRKSRSLLVSPKAPAKIDLEKLKQALKEAEKKKPDETKAAEPVKTPEVQQAVPPVEKDSSIAESKTVEAQNTPAQTEGQKNSEAAEPKKE